MKNQNTNEYCTPIQLKLPIDISKIIDISDPVYTFNEVMEHIDLRKYFGEEKVCKMGRPRYALEVLLKVVLFAFMEYGYCSVREIAKLCRIDIRFMWLLGEDAAPSHMTIENFMKNSLQVKLEDIIADINGYIFVQEGVDLQHVYLDGTKIEANAGKYTWVWKKSCITNRNTIFAKIRSLLPELNEILSRCKRIKLEPQQEYSIESVEYILTTFAEGVGLHEEEFVHGSGKRKSKEQKLYEHLKEYCQRLICNDLCQEAVCP